MNPGAPAEVRFEQRVFRCPMSGCWLWTGGLASNGYGQFWMKSRSIVAHRASWLLHVGDIPNGLRVLHKCDVRLCTNPAHLFLGTDADNVADMVSKGRQRGSGWSKLTADEVVAIRADPRSHKEVANIYNVTASNICVIRRGKSWKQK